MSEKLIQSKQKLQKSITGYQESCILGAAAELDFFGAILETETATANEIAEKTSASLRGTTVLLDALCAIGYLAKTDDRYGIVEDYRELFDTKHPQTFVPMMRHISACIRSWAQLAWSVKAGFPAPDIASIRGFADDFVSFILGMNSVAVSLAPQIVERMNSAGLLGFKHLLDVGGASGTYTKAFLSVLPEVRATIFDQPVAILEAKKKTESPEFADRIELVSGDFYRDELPKGADFAWISAIIHQMDRPMSRDLYAKVFRALVPGGRVAIRDVYLDSSRTKPLAGALFAVNMLSGTDHGMSYTVEEVREDLELSGFTDVDYALPADDMSAVIIARKPD